MSIALYILVMAGVTYLIRVIPFAAVRGTIRSRFVRSFLFYIPYAVLSAMTFPAIFYSTGDTLSAAVGTAAAVILAYFGLPLIVVSLGGSLAAFAVMLIM